MSDLAFVSSVVMTREVSWVDLDFGNGSYWRSEALELADEINDRNLPVQDNVWEAMELEVEAMLLEAFVDASYRWA